jgi:hypothetical protein
MNFHVFKWFKAEERLPYEMNALSTDVFHDVIGMFLQWLETVVPNMPCQHSEAVLFRLYIFNQSIHLGS